jgi:acetyl/propionyl-CoA carboxylase alpha subunit
MIGKLIVWDETRETCIVRMQRALSELMVDGVPTTAKFHRRLLEHPDFRNLEIHTGWLEQKKNDLIHPEQELGGTALAEDGAAIALGMVDQSQQDELNSSIDAWKSTAMLNGLRLS